MRNWDLSFHVTFESNCGFFSELGIIFFSTMLTKFRLIRLKKDDCTTSVRNKRTTQVCCFPALCPLAAKCHACPAKQQNPLNTVYHTGC